MKQTYNPLILKALGALEGLSANDLNRRITETRENTLINSTAFAGEHAEREYREEGRREGFRAGRVETARNLLAMGKISNEDITVATGLDIEEIKRLEKDVQEDGTIRRR